MKKALALLIVTALSVLAQVPQPSGSGGSGSGSGTVSGTTGQVACFDAITSVGDCTAGTGIAIAAGVISVDRAVIPTKATAAGTPTMTGQLTGDIAVDTSASPNRFYICGADDGTDCTAVIRIGGYAEMLPLSGGTLTGQLVTDNLGIEFEESDTNPTCAAGNYNIYADTSETKLKACQNGVASDLVGGGGGTTHQVFMNLAGNTVASTTSYAGPSAASFGTETARAFLVTRDTTFTKMYLRTSGTQGACDATVTLRNTSTAADTAITFTIANGATTQTFSDTAHTAAFTAGQRAVVKVASTGCTSATITEISLEYN